jgi:enoyl-CoA hydratase
LPRQIPFPAAMEFLLTAEAFPAEQALEWGLINRIVDPANLMDEALAFAHRITANAPLAVQGTKEAVLRSLAAGSMKEGYQIENEISGVVFQSEDAKEGPQAFAEKRPPRWTGS